MEQREIKFKIWMPYSKIMMQPKDIITIHESILNGVTIGQMKQWVYLQNTGLKDKNGKEIYEGDIVRVYNKEELLLVIYENGCFYTPHSTSNYRLGGWKQEAIEVIGNVHANPELITTK